MIRLWTDGCCLKNPGGAGGWAFVVERNGEVLDTCSGYSASTTNNRMEMTAVIEALRYQAHPTQTEIVCDSKYVVNGITLWVPRWKEYGWAKTKSGRGTIANLRLWRDIDALVEAYTKPLRFRWVKGHALNPFNELADELAGNAARAIKNV